MVEIYIDKGWLDFYDVAMSYWKGMASESEPYMYQSLATMTGELVVCTYVFRFMDVYCGRCLPPSPEACAAPPEGFLANAGTSGSVSVLPPMYWGPRENLGALNKIMTSWIYEIGYHRVYTWNTNIICIIENVETTFMVSTARSACANLVRVVRARPLGLYAFELLTEI